MLPMVKKLFDLLQKGRYDVGYDGEIELELVHKDVRAELKIDDAVILISVYDIANPNKPHLHAEYLYEKKKYVKSVNVNQVAPYVEKIARLKKAGKLK